MIQVIGGADYDLLLKQFQSSILLAAPFTILASIFDQYGLKTTKDSRRTPH